MFKEENRIWLYIVGIVALLVLLMFASVEYFIPVLTGKRDVFFRAPFVYQAAPDYTLESGRNYLANIHTNKGLVIVDLYELNAPKNVNNFVFLSKAGYYDGTKFHRLIPGMLVQGGDRNTLNEDLADDGRGGPGYLIGDEVNWDSLNFGDTKRDELTRLGYQSTPNLESKPLEKFTLAMASAGPDTNGSQFFFVLAHPDDPRLEELSGRFTVIGKLSSGAEVLNSFAAIEVDENNRPLEDLIVERIEIVTR